MVERTGLRGSERACAYVMCRMGVVGARALAHIRFCTSAPSLAVGELRASCPPPSTHAVSLGITMIMSCLLWHRVHAHPTGGLSRIPRVRSGRRATCADVYGLRRSAEPPEL